MDNKPGFLKTFFSAIGTAFRWFRAIVVNLVFLIFLFLIVSLFWGGGEGPLPEKAPLRIQVSGFLVDQRSYISPVSQLTNPGLPAEIVVRELVDTLNKAATDPKITHLILDLNNFQGANISKLEEVGTALRAFKTQKPIIAYADYYQQHQYYLASYANDIYLNPLGGVLITGYGGYRNYFNSLLEKLGVNVHVFKVGEYKDAVEPYIRDDMSAASREHNSQWINQLWSVYTSRIEELRELPKDAINDYVNNLDSHLEEHNGNAAQLALNSQLVTGLANRAELREQFMEKFGKNKKGDSYTVIDYQRYLNHLKRKSSMATQKVGLVVASGTIYDGIQPPGNIGGDSLALQIREARESGEYSAIVLRVDSGGGSAFASEVIRNELVATQNAGIPVVVSMGSVAASGGYWIAANADEIWATPTTLTGSIGVFSIIPTLENTLEKIGVSTDGVATTDLAGAMRLDRPMSPLAESVLQSQVDDIYRRFIDLVADGRNTQPERIHTIAGGRVWSGTSALNFGLVDQLGYLNDAIASAAKLADVQDYKVELIEPKLTPMERFTQNLFASSIQILQNTGALFDSPFSIENFVKAPLPSTLKSTAATQLQTLSDFMSAPQGKNVFSHCLHCLAPDR